MYQIEAYDLLLVISIFNFSKRRAFLSILAILIYEIFQRSTRFLGPLYLAPKTSVALVNYNNRCAIDTTAIERMLWADQGCMRGGGVSMASVADMRVYA